MRYGEFKSPRKVAGAPRRETHILCPILCSQPPQTAHLLNAAVPAPWGKAPACFLQQIQVRAPSRGAWAPRAPLQTEATHRPNSSAPPIQAAAPQLTGTVAEGRGAVTKESSNITSQQASYKKGLRAQGCWAVSHLKAQALQEQQVVQCLPMKPKPSFTPASVSLAPRSCTSPTRAAESKPPVLYSKHHILSLVKTALEVQGKAATPCHPARGVGREMPFDINVLQLSQSLRLILNHTFLHEKNI